MALKMVCIKKDGGNHENRHTAISSLGWVNESTGVTGTSTRLEMYDYLMKGGLAYVRDYRGDVAYLIPAKTSGGTKYVKTVADETKADNLLLLPECRV